jgi:hypothetical protein
VKGALLAIGLGAAAIALPHTAAAQELPACPSDKTMDARVTSQERGAESPIVATHEVTLEADVADRVSPVSSSPDHVAITPEAGVQVVKGQGSSIFILAPATSTLTVVVTWRQSTDPSNFDETGRCTGSQTITLPVLSATPARGAKQPNPGPATGDYTFAIAAATKRPDLRPLEISVRSTGHARYPRASERLRRWTLPMRTAEQVNYHKRLPNLAYATTAQKCRFWWFTCGPTFAHLAQLNVNSRGTGPDLSGSNSILRDLAYTQPARWAARFGIVITATPGALRPNAWGYDIQVRQGGRLLARVRRAGRCRTEHRSYGLFDHCKLSRSSTLLR